MTTVFVGDINPELSSAAKSHDNTAYLVDHNNYLAFLTNPTGTVYTSAADLPPITDQRSVLFEILNCADQIFYLPPKVWSDFSVAFSWTSQQRITEYYLDCINRVKQNVIGLNLSHYNNVGYLNLTQHRQTDQQCLWVAGCSVAHGVGVDQQQRFGQLVAQKLCLPVYHLTHGGYSIEWAVDQLVRSDVRSGDTVILGITSEFRAPNVNNGTVISESDVDILTKEFRLYKALISIHQLVNFCRKINCKLLLLPVLCSENLRMYLHNIPEYQQLPYQHRFLDLGTDGQHPGPLQHKFWAEVCLQHLES